MGKMNKKGFTLAELLIVIAIMAVLLAVAIPVFSSQLEKARDSVDANTERAAKSLAEAHYLLEHASGGGGSITCTFSEYGDGNLQIKTCTGCTEDLPGKGDPAVTPECSGETYVAPLEIVVTDGKVSGGWATP